MVTNSSLAQDAKAYPAMVVAAPAIRTLRRSWLCEKAYVPMEVTDGGTSTLTWIPINCRTPTI